MDEQLLRGAIADYCYTLRVICNSFKKRATFFEHAAREYSLSKSRAELYLRFAELVQLCRDTNTTAPAHPDSIAPLVALPKKDWLDLWRMILDCSKTGNGGQLPTCGQLPNADGVRAVLQRFNIQPHRIPKHILERRKIQNAARTLASAQDGEALADRLGARGFGRDWDNAVRVTIDADQRRMDLDREARNKRANAGG